MSSLSLTSVLKAASALLNHLHRKSFSFAYWIVFRSDDTGVNLNDARATAHDVGPGGQWCFAAVPFTTDQGAFLGHGGALCGGFELCLGM